MFSDLFILFVWHRPQWIVIIFLAIKMSKLTSDKHSAKSSSLVVSADAEQAEPQHFDNAPSPDISSLIHDINNCVMLISILSESYETKASLSTGADDATQAITVNEPGVILRDNVSQLIDMLGELYQVLPQRKAKPKNLEIYNNAKFIAFLESKSKIFLGANWLVWLFVPLSHVDIKVIIFHEDTTHLFSDFFFTHVKVLDRVLSRTLFS